MKKLAIIIVLLSSVTVSANDLLPTKPIIKPVLKPTLLPKPILKPSIELISESALESLERASKFAEALMSSDEGGWSGNGGGSRDESDNIWFIGDSSTPIKYCLSKAPDYPLKGNELKSLIEQSITEWVEFFKSYNLANNNLAGGFAHPRMNTLQFSDGKNRKLITDFEYTNNCDEARLQFLFGLENKVITNYKKFATEHPFGLAVRQRYDHKNFAHNGIIWIDNFSKKEKEIKHMILHELGHMFGMKHDSVPVMDENLVQFLGKRREFGSSFIGQIESDAWTYGLKENHPIVMTSTRGKKPRRRRLPPHAPRRENLCGDDATFTTNRNIPRPILRGLNLNKNDCHKVTLTYLGSQRERAMSKKLFTLEIEELNSKRKGVFSGKFKLSAGSRPKFKGPGVVTKLKAKRLIMKEHKMFRKLTLEKTPDMLPLTGRFNLGREAFAAKMTSNKGLVIELFVPGAKSWWTFKTHYNQN